MQIDIEFLLSHRLVGIPFLLQIAEEKPSLGVVTSSQVPEQNDQQPLLRLRGWLIQEIDFYSPAETTEEFLVSIGDRFVS